MSHGPGRAVEQPVNLTDPAAMRIFLERHGFVVDEPITIDELSGGISCRVMRVETSVGSVIVKQALPELRVREHWSADVGRADVEAAYGRTVQRLVPGASPDVLAHDPTVHAFVMASAPAGSQVWKEKLLQGEISLGTARRVGEVLGLIHERAAAVPELADQFADRSNFRSLRIVPYLEDIRQRHPDRAGAIGAVIDDLQQAGITLVHGDVSPKNILVSPAGGVLLIDHEVAHWGRPAFDTAFVINHLCLKAVHRPEYARDYRAATEALLSAYAEAAPTAGAGRDETGRVLAALLLARIDGRSPVEYLGEAERQQVRTLARAALADQVGLDELLQRITASTTISDPDEDR